MFEDDNPYLPQARLAVRVLRYVAEEPALALKGGTAINLFHRDLPRLSVDLDLTYVPGGNRSTALREIERCLRNIAAAVTRALRTRIELIDPPRGRLLVRDGNARVKVEVNTVLRGSVAPPVSRAGLPGVTELFGDIEAQVLGFEDLFAGKIVAALDRQHARDLFDVKLLLEHEGLTEPLLEAFVVYLVSHDRPIAEVLAPTDKDVRRSFESEFAEMTAEPVTLDELLEARLRLVRELHGRLGERRARFLRSVKALEPDWSLLLLPHARELPGVRWKLENLERFRREQPARYAEARDDLERVLHQMG